MPYDGRNRKYYSITEKGREKLEYYKAAWIEHKKTVDLILEGGTAND